MRERSERRMKTKTNGFDVRSFLGFLGIVLKTLLQYDDVLL